MDDIKLPPLPAIDDYLPTDGPRWTTANFIACVERYATDYARAALAAAPAPAPLTDGRVRDAYMSTNTRTHDQTFAAFRDGVRFAERAHGIGASTGSQP